MKPVTAIVAEDEAPQREALCRMLGEVWPELVIVAECPDGLAAVEALHKHRPAIAFVDIRMPGLGGLEVARAASGIAHVVFTTAYEEYALSAFEHGAIDYLLKPIRRERLQQSLLRVRERLRTGAVPDIETLVGALSQRLRSDMRRDTLKWITASVGDTLKMFAIDEVLFFQAQDKYIRVVTTDDEACIRTPLKDLLAGLDPEQFWQVHRGVIVRATAIHKVRRDELGKWQISLKSHKDTLPVSSAFAQRFKAM